MPPERILLAVDGEPHTGNAIDWALELGEKLGLVVTAVHVKDPYLKQFSNELYAQGREEYLDHVDDALEEKAVQVSAAFEVAVKSSEVKHDIKILFGDPLEALVKEARDPEYRLIVLGKKASTGRLHAWRSRNLPRALLDAVMHLPMMVVPGWQDTSVG